MIQVDDKNYSEFIKQKKAVLLITLSTCHFCSELKPRLEEIEKTRQDIAFGEAILNNGRLVKLKRTYDIPFFMPSMFFFQNGWRVQLLQSFAQDPIKPRQINRMILKLWGTEK